MPLSSDTSLPARTFIRNVRGGGGAQFDPWGHVAGGLGCVSRVASQRFKLFWDWAYLRQTPGFPQHPRGRCFRTPPKIGFPHPSGDRVYASPRGLGFRIPSEFGFTHPSGAGIGFTHPHGGWVSESPIPVYARKIWVQIGVFLLEGTRTFPY